MNDNKVLTIEGSDPEFLEKTFINYNAKILYGKSEIGNGKYSYTIIISEENEKELKEYLNKINSSLDLNFNNPSSAETNETTIKSTLKYEDIKKDIFNNIKRGDRFKEL